MIWAEGDDVWSEMSDAQANRLKGRTLEFVIRVDGLLSERITSRFENLEIQMDESTTTLYGKGPDSGLLHGVMAHLQELGLEVLSVATIEASK